MHRFFSAVISYDPKKKTLRITDKELLHQIKKVLRLKVSDSAEFFDSAKFYRGTLIEIADAFLLVAVERVQDIAEKPVFLSVYISLLKNDRFEWALQKCTELGASEFVPLLCQRTVARDLSANKMIRYQKIIKEAAEQSGGGALPRLEPLREFSDACEMQHDFDASYLMSLRGKKVLSPSFSKKIKRIRIFIGPEGGWSEEEEELAERFGLSFVSLGGRILRAETAAVSACSVLLLNFNTI